MRKKTEESRIIKTAMLRKKIDSFQELAALMGVNYPALGYNLRNPGGISLTKLRAIIKAAGLTDEEIIKLVRE